MRDSILAVSLALCVLAAGCAGNGDPEPDGGNPDGAGGAITTPRDLEQQKIRVLKLLETFEGRDVAEMEAACVELLEMESDKLVSADILASVRKFQQPGTRHAALERLRWISKVARNLLLLEIDKPDADERQDWVRCRDTMVRLGREAVVRFVGVLIVKFPTNQSWCRGMLMDLCISPGVVAQDAIVEALVFHGVDQPGALDRSLLDDNTREGLASVLIFLPDPPVERIRRAAAAGPISTRRAFARLLGSLRRTEPGTGRATPSPPWACDLLAEMIRTDKAWQVRADAANGLGAAGDPVRCVPALTAALKDTDHFVRINTCKGLGLYGSVARDAIPALIEMVRGLENEGLKGNPRRELENNALVALKILTGKQFQTLNAFLAWYDYENPKK